MKKQIRIEKITIEHLPDEYPDLSYLESSVINGKINSCQYTQEEYDENPTQVMEYIEQDTERLNNYGNVWHMMGIQAKAEVSYPIDNQGNRRIEWFTSGGLWGIESDSDNDYIKEVEQEQLQDLKGHLKTFGVNVSNFDKINIERN